MTAAAEPEAEVRAPVAGGATGQEGDTIGRLRDAKRRARRP